MSTCLVRKPKDKLIKSHLGGMTFVLMLSAQSDFNMQFIEHVY